MNKTKISKTTTGNVGEHYVAAELERINFTTSVVGNNCKDYDKKIKTLLFPLFMGFF